MVDLVERRRRELADSLRACAAEDLLRGLGAARAARLLSGPARRAVGRFVADLTELDAAVARGGLGAAAEVIIPRYSGSLTIRDAGRVPTTGPLVVAANHVGTVDAPALWRLLAARDDLRIIALDRPILHAMPHLASRLLPVTAEAHDRTRLVRRVVDHLRSGGALLTFPAGGIEPDPALRPDDALTSLDTWGSGVEVFARLIPETVVLPVAVSGVISRRMLRHPLARRRASPADRELAAATLQVLVRERVITPQLAVGEPLGGPATTADLRAAMAALIGARH